MSGEYLQVELRGAQTLIRKLQRLGADDGDIAKELTIATSQTTKQVRRRADRLLSAELGTVVKTVKDYFPHPRTTRGGIYSQSYLNVGFDSGITWDKFKVRKIGGRRGREGVSVNTGRKKFAFPKAFIFLPGTLRGNTETLMFERKPGSREIYRPRTKTPAEYIQAGGGVPVLRDYAIKRLQANVKYRLEWAIIKAERANGNG